MKSKWEECVRQFFFFWMSKNWLFLIHYELSENQKNCFFSVFGWSSYIQKPRTIRVKEILSMINDHPIQCNAIRDRERNENAGDGDKRGEEGRELDSNSQWSGINFSWLTSKCQDCMHHWPVKYWEVQSVIDQWQKTPLHSAIWYFHWIFWCILVYISPMYSFLTLAISRLLLFWLKESCFTDQLTSLVLQLICTCAENKHGKCFVLRKP